MVTHGRELKDERNRLTNRIRQHLWRYYQQALELNEDMGADWVLDLLALGPTLGTARRLTEKKIARVLSTHRIRRITMAKILNLLQVPAITVAGGTELAASAHIAAVAERLQLVNRQFKDVARRLERIFASLPGTAAQPGDPEGQPSDQRDAVILRSLPRVGRTVLATLLAETNQALQARDYYTLRTLCGVARVTKRSGKSIRAERRQACSHRSREALYHWATVVAQHDPIAKARYAALRVRSHTHGRAGDRLLAVECALLKSQKTVQPREPKLAGTHPRITRC